MKRDFANVEDLQQNPQNEVTPSPENSRDSAMAIKQRRLTVSA